MPTYRRESPMPVSAQALHDWHARPGAFERLSPTWQHLRPIHAEGGIRDGARRVFRLGRFPLAPVWEAVHEDWIDGRQFVDRALRSPFRSWRHLHRFEAAGRDRSVLVDEVAWMLPFPALTQPLLGPLAHRMLDRMFRQRHARTRQDLMRHLSSVDSPPLTIAVSGASGLIGEALCAFLTTGGHRVRRLVRRDPQEDSEIRWDPSREAIDAEALEGVDAVVHLAGEGIARRWSAEQKERIRQSRVLGTGLLARAIAGLRTPPRVFVSASAIGYYGSRGDAILTEESEAGNGFLPEVCAAWEKAAEPARAAGVRVVHPRIGVVLSPQGGALAQMLPAFRMGVGGRVGSGAQYMSPIALDDVVGALHWMLTTPSAEGAYNLTLPEPVSNREFTQTLGDVLGRPTVLPLPAPVVRLLFGEMGERLLLEGQRVLPARLQREGFSFLHPTLGAALRFELGLLREEMPDRGDS